ncbi:spore protease YyaC [Paenibacillus spiritus]|uniref:Spore protease YyaC n=1 Tax=Paenibacillus spiritus TaxID=2496557 RepID=A0A5J5G580_9BACL|nr:MULTISPECIES: spore protease YyaC [Paenibacillus]KAA9002118.1 spore protease YyaC [Paenibacillus spiritus]
MAGWEQHNGGSGRVKMDGGRLTSFFAEIAEKHHPDEIVFLCIGTDRSTGDALGPLTGSLLAAAGFPHVIGTLPAPCDADTFGALAAGIQPGRIIVAIDACLGPPWAVGFCFAAEGPLHPAQSIGLVLPAVGDYSVAAVVAAAGPKPYRTLQTTPLHRVMGMADQIAAAAAAGFGIGRPGVSSGGDRA